MTGMMTELHVHSFLYPFTKGLCQMTRLNIMNKVNVLKTIFFIITLLSFGSFAAQSSSPQSTKPNVILIMADDLGWGDVGFNGNKKIITPQMDELAAQGIKLNNFYAAAPLCSPTRASVLTGRNPFRQGIFAAHTAGMRIGEVTIAEVLKKEGYATGLFGKWHIGRIEPDEVQSRGNYSPPKHHGFEEVFATKSAVPTWNPTKSPPNWKSYGYKKDGSWGGSRYLHNDVPVTENLEGDDSRIIMDRALPFIDKSADDGKPFLAAIWFHTPHEPIWAGPEYLAKYPDLPEEQKHLYGTITAMDEQIGRLRSYLKAKGIEDNTIIFFTSDNGPGDPQVKSGVASAGPYRGHKHQMWEGGLRVPSLIYWPAKIRQGFETNFQANTNDYFPTILDILNIKPKKSIPLDGISLLPMMQGEATERDGIFASGYQRLYEGKELYALIDGRYKIVIPDKGEKIMLFDIEADPTESKDLSQERTVIFNTMLAQLEKVKASWKHSREGGDYKW